MIQEEKRYIYIVFSSTNTGMGKLIRLLTHNQFNHVSLAFEENLEVMYSFARYHINAPLVGGFVEEYPERFLVEHQDIFIKICKVPLKRERYDEVRKVVLNFLCRREEIVYNSFSALTSLVHKSIYIKNAYTCVEFIAFILQMEKVTSISELEEGLRNYEIYSGTYGNITGFKENTQDDFLDRQSLQHVVLCTARHFTTLLGRAFLS